jgi:hypothetical protein
VNRLSRAAVAIVMLCALAAAGCARPDRVGDLPFFPGASYVGSTSTTGEQFGFPPASWQQVELRTEAAFDKVRDFYAKAAIRGQTATFESEQPKSTGRVYNKFMADQARRRFYAITVEERAALGHVSVLLRYGVAR